MAVHHNVETGYLEEILADRLFRDTEITSLECKLKLEWEEITSEKVLFFSEFQPRQTNHGHP